ncbi:MAG: exo-alpha-sialidase [Planctomycetes bacterium]|nr:exo-alpha-sialidase [Planctomycetota bacterium]
MATRIPFRTRALLAVTATIAPLASQTDAERRAVVAVDEIWARAPHAAFVDLERHRGALWCAFREGSGHVPGTNGVIRVLHGTPDGQRWESAALLDVAGLDLRDPKLSVTPRGELMVLMGGSEYRGRERVAMQPHAAFGRPDDAGEGITFAPPAPIALPTEVASGQDWLWRVTWRGDVGYGVVYQPGAGGNRLHLVATTDGRSYRSVTELDLDPASRGGETTLRFLPDGRMLALVRTEGGDRNARLGCATSPFTAWTWVTLPHRIGGPDLLVLPGPTGPTLLAAGRAYDPDGSHTALWRVTLDGGSDRLLTLPSGGDTSYPRLVPCETDDGPRLLCAYYSSHLGGRTSILLATLRTAELLGAR